MKQSRFNERQIINILKEADADIAVLDLCRKHGISNSTFYQWRSKYGGLEVSGAQRLKALKIENQRLKQMDAELSLEHQVLKEIVEESRKHPPTPTDGWICH